MPTTGTRDKAEEQHKTPRVPRWIAVLVIAVIFLALSATALMVYRLFG